MCSDEEMIQALYSLSRGLDATYLRFLERIQENSTSDLKLASKVLKWISSSLRPLTSDELKEAVSIEYTDINWTAG